MQWIFISPHFDDVALSCGGLVWELTHAGNKVSIWTVCGGTPAHTAHSPIIDALHERWKSGDQAAIMRRQEDVRSCQVLKADYIHFDVFDCIYRVDENGNPLYPTEESLFGSIHQIDIAIIDRVVQEFLRSIPKRAKVVCPLAVGNHVDHQLSRQIIEKIRKNTWYYADFPYVMRNQPQTKRILVQGWVSKKFSLSDQGYQAWIRSVSAHQSQLSTFWKNNQEMDDEFRQYRQKNRGIRLWRSKQNE